MLSPPSEKPPSTKSEDAFGAVASREAWEEDEVRGFCDIVDWWVEGGWVFVVLRSGLPSRSTKVSAI